MRPPAAARLPAPVLSSPAQHCLGVLHRTLHEGACVEREVKRALRAGSRDGVTTAESRAAVASACFGVCTLRVRLAYMLRHATRKAEDTPWAAAVPRGRDADAALLALWLLHERAHRAPAGALERCGLLAGSLGLDPDLVCRLRALRPSDLPLDRLALVPRLAIEHSLPIALVRTWARALPEDEVAALARLCNRPGPVTLRANVAVGGRDALRLTLAAAGVDARAGALSPWAVHLGGDRAAWGGGVWALPGWRAGAFEVQDEGSQCIASACAATAGEIALDLCAGNGGKTLALAAAVGAAGRLYAHDVDAARLRSLRARAERAHVAARITVLPTPPAVATAPPVDIALVDAPCSSTGVIRRHPGLRWAVDRGSPSAKDLPTLQLRLLRRAAAAVRADGGRLVYATCSLDARENEEIAHAFERSADGRAFEPWPFGASCSGRHASSAGRHLRTLWPQRHGTDGFFIARWRRRAAI